MKQIQIAKPGGLANLKLMEVAAPTPMGNEVLVRVGASSLNYHDLMVAQGAIPTKDGRVPLSDCCGEVIAVGSGVTKWSVGDTVMGCCFPHWLDGPPQTKLLGFIGDNLDGYATEQIAIAESALTRAPRGWTTAEAATLPCAGLTAWTALVDKGGLKKGETVLVQGTGGVSIFALQLAKAMGATVIATSSSDAKLERLKQLGADHVVNYANVPKWGKAVVSLTNGRGVDHVIEVGGAGTFGESLKCCKLGGHIALIGILGGPAVSQMVLPKIFLKQIRISGISMGNQNAQERMVGFLDTTAIRPVISDTFPLSRLADAFQHQVDHKHFGKIAIQIAGPTSML